MPFDQLELTNSTRGERFFTSIAYFFHPRLCYLWQIPVLRSGIDVVDFGAVTFAARRTVSVLAAIPGISYVKRHTLTQCVARRICDNFRIQSGMIWLQSG